MDTKLRLAGVYAQTKAAQSLETTAPKMLCDVAFPSTWNETPFRVKKLIRLPLHITSSKGSGIEKHVAEEGLILLGLLL
jgi:hypothetical protein